MINANELRIGNFINVLHGDVQIDKFITAGVHFTDQSGGNFQALSPIPLTEEWLLKFGFSKESGHYIFPITKLAWVDSKMEFNGFTMGGKVIVCYSVNGKWGSDNLHYVHQVQNLYFAITGDEIKIA